jgi:hypothetical protein
VQLGYSEQQQRQCRYQPALAAADGCIAFLDLGTRNATARIESVLSDLNIGLLIHYIGRQSHVGMLNGTSQFQLGLYGRFNFTAGDMPPLGF